MVKPNKAAAVRAYLERHSNVSRADVVKAMADQGLTVTEAYVTTIKVRNKAKGASKEKKASRKNAKTSAKKTSKTNAKKTSQTSGRTNAGRTPRKKAKKTRAGSGGSSDYPRHSVEKALRIPQAILQQNAGKACTDQKAAEYSGVGYHGPFRVELSSSIKFGFLERPQPGHVVTTELAKRIIRPQAEAEKLDGLRQALLNAPKFSDVYKHYRGENIPDEPFFGNALVDSFAVPQEKKDEFKQLFLESLKEAELLEEHGGKRRVVDVSQGARVDASTDETLKKLGRGLKIEEGDSCFVMMPFANPLGGYYKAVYEPAIKKAGLRPVRADDDIFATGKIMDQIWRGITTAKVLVAELTGRNPNVFYELGLAHALRKPVVLVSSNENDVPFDIQHIRVVYYDQSDPFWGDKLISKVAENILSALKNPQEATFNHPPS